MKIPIPFMAIWLLCQLPVFLPAQVTPAVQTGRELLRAFQQEQHIPGISVTVMKQGKVVWSEGFGFADLEQQVPVNPARTRFRVGSISKPMTAALLGLLYEEGKLDLDAPVQKYVPDFPEKKYPITTRQLGGHLAGIRHYNGLEFLSSRYYPTVTAGLAIFKDDSLLHRPGTRYRYSSYGWNLISAVLEGAGGGEFLEMMQQRVFDPLGLEHTCADVNRAIIPFRTRFYEVDANQQVYHAPYVDNSYKWAGGGFISTSEEVARFAQAHLHPGFLKQSTLDVLLTPQHTLDGESTHYGIGWRSGRTEAGHEWFGHSGGSVGGTSQMVVFPGQEIVVVMLSNSGSVNYRGLQLRIASLFMEE